MSTRKPQPLIGKIPQPTSVSDALREIRMVARDKRTRVMLSDQCEWLQAKLKAISILAARGLKICNTPLRGGVPVDQFVKELRRYRRGK